MTKKQKRKMYIAYDKAIGVVDKCKNVEQLNNSLKYVRFFHSLFVPHCRSFYFTEAIDLYLDLLRRVHKLEEKYGSKGIY